MSKTLTAKGGLDAPFLVTVPNKNYGQSMPTSDGRMLYDSAPHLMMTAETLADAASIWPDSEGKRVWEQSAKRVDASQELLEAAKIGLQYVRERKLKGSKSGVRVSSILADEKLISDAIAKAEGTK